MRSSVSKAMRIARKKAVCVLFRNPSRFVRVDDGSWYAMGPDGWIILDSPPDGNAKGHQIISVGGLEFSFYVRIR